MSISGDIRENLTEKYHKQLKNCNLQTLYNVICDSVMDSIYDMWHQNRKTMTKSRQAVYLSAEYLMGRMIYNNLLNLGVLDEIEDFLGSAQIDILRLEDIEDAALGNGGLGRLAACYLDSAAQLEKPLIGYGIRYKYGLFRQAIENGRQVEKPDDWQAYGDPWGRKRVEKRYKVDFGDESVYAVAYDYPIIPYKSDYINTLRLFEAQGEFEFDFSLFNEQKYEQSVSADTKAKILHFCLYPNDDKRAGKALRLKQEYFFVSAAIQDMLRSYEVNIGTDYKKFHEYYSVSLNDTHPVLAIPELVMRLCENGVDYFEAVEIAKKTFNYTNHTVLPEALEKWDKKLFKSVLPKIYAVVMKLNNTMSSELQAMGIDNKRIEQVEIINSHNVNMANLACYCSSKINGVAALHTKILKQKTLKDWYDFYPEKFLNITNGITQRRWLRLCNRDYAEMISEKIGNGYITNLSLIKELLPFCSEKEFLSRFIKIKAENKKRLCEYVAKKDGKQLPFDAVFDVQIKRLHEYKRQLLNAFSALHYYFEIKQGSIKFEKPVVMLFGAKAAPGYKNAKAIIKFINEIASLIENDDEVSKQLKVVFVSNYNVSYAEKIIPATDISEQISCAGTEASGTGNMKFMLNGAVTLGTYDGANIEIVAAAGEQNNYIFGAKENELEKLKEKYDPLAIYESNPRIKRVADCLINGIVSDDASGEFAELFNSLLAGENPDKYFVFYDFESYIEQKTRCIMDCIENKYDFAKKCVLNTACSGRFSSDRSVSEYCEKVWNI